MNALTGWQIEEIAPALGAVVRGIDMGGELDDDQWEAIDALFAAHLVLVFPHQKLTPKRHVEIGEHFGDPYIHPFLTAIPDHPAILEVLKEPEDEAPFGGEHWHCDISFTDPAASVSLLYGIEIPPSGGDTLFANTALAYSQLSPGMKGFLEGLNAHHTYPGKSEQEHGASALHPVVRIHPVTGLKSLYVNTAFVHRFEDMTERESAPLIEFLCEHQTRPDYQTRIPWEPDQLVIWDNRATVHYALNDYPGVRRNLHRVTVLERV